MPLDCDIDNIESTEFGIGRKQPGKFYLVSVDSRVQQALRIMVRQTLAALNPGTREPPYYEPTEKYGSTEYCYVALEDPMAAVFRDLWSAVNIESDQSFPSDMGNWTCYFVRLTDRKGRRAIGIHRAGHFKGLVKKPVLRWINGGLRLVDDELFKLDKDFDLIVDGSGIHVLRPKSFEMLGKLKKRILEAAGENVAALANEIPFVDFGPVRSYAATRVRAARYVSAIRRHTLKGMDVGALERLCMTAGIGVRHVDGKLSVAAEDVMTFLEVLDRRRYSLELVQGSPEYYRASSRQRVGR